MFAFAQAAMDDLKKRCAGALTDWIFIVDIFELFLKQQVVNEFESLEASRPSRDSDGTTYATESIKKYFINVLTKLTNWYIFQLFFF